MRISDWSSDVCSSDLPRGLLYRLWRDQKLLEVAIAARSRQTYVTGPEGVADVEQHRDFPKPVVAARLTAKMTMPFRVGASTIQRRIYLDHVTQHRKRRQKRRGHWRRPNVGETTTPGRVKA